MDATEATASASSAITNMLLWMVVPSTVTNFLLKCYYYVKYAKNSPSRPKPQSPRHKRHYRNCYSLIVALYLLYCMGDTVYSMERSYYSKIGVKRHRSHEDLRRRTRQLLLMYHPDKSSSGHMDKYLELKGMSEVIENPNLCNIYEKFGESGVKTVSQASSKKNFLNAEEVRRDYIYSTLIEWVAFYASMLVMALCFSFTSKTESGRYWQLTGMLLLAAYESYLYLVDFTSLESIQRETEFVMLQPQTWYPYLLSGIPLFQRIRFVRKLLTYTGFAMSQCGPLWFPSQPDLFTDKKALQQEVEAIGKLATAQLQQEALFVFKTSSDAFADNPEMRSLLKRQMGQVAMDLRVLETMSNADGAESRKNR